jgi:hypothetical protein
MKKIAAALSMCILFYACKKKETNPPPQPDFKYTHVYKGQTKYAEKQVTSGGTKTIADSAYADSITVIATRDSITIMYKTPYSTSETFAVNLPNVYPSRKNKKDIYQEQYTINGPEMWGTIYSGAPGSMSPGGPSSYHYEFEGKR